MTGRQVREHNPTDARWLRFEVPHGWHLPQNPVHPGLTPRRCLAPEEQGHRLDESYHVSLAQRLNALCIHWCMGLRVQRTYLYGTEERIQCVHEELRLRQHRRDQP
jgi:hypothetical protein